MPELTRVRAAVLVAALLLTTSAPAGAAPSTPAGDGLGQTLAPDQPVVSGAATLDRGHVDIGPLLRDGRWTIGLHDDTRVPSVWRRPSDVVLDIGNAARVTAPRDPDYAFLGAAAGRPVYVIPQTQNRDVVWTGWNTQDPAVLGQVSLGATFTFHGVRGPGQLFVFLQSGTLGAPDLLWSSTRRGAQRLFVERNTHTHANWVFTRPGVYLVDFEISAKLVSGRTVTDRQSLRFAVGDGTDAAQARAAVPTPRTVPAPSASTHAVADARTDSGGIDPVWLVALAIVVLLGGGVGTTVVRSRRLASRALEDDR